MNLKKIEVYGFKSFADRLTIDFNEGVTGIVGPNGCGKSNVVDAIRFVLGEQSPKNLRAGKMTDVIFGGTEKNRKSLSFCQVSLYIDNTQRIFPKSPFDEVIISRKLFKSGQSEYLLNNETVRLKDILDLIRDTGVGKDGYSIVGQGKIDEIMNAKPENRRAIFEDAAGILTYKMRRNETIKKLNNANDSIEKLKIALDGLEKQLGPLAKQREAALQAYDGVYAEAHALQDEGRRVCIVAEGDAGFYSSVHYVFERLQADGRVVKHVAGIPAFIAAGALAGLHTASQEQRLTVLPGTATTQELERLVGDGGTVLVMKLSQCADEVHRCIGLHPEYTYHYFENVGTAAEFYTCDAAVVAARRFPYFSLMIVQV